MLSFPLPQIWLYDKLRLLHPPTVPSNQYQPKRYRDHKFKSKEMDPDEFTEFLKRLFPSWIQWVVEWWRITVFKGKCVPLVGLPRYSYYSICRIARQFGDCQGAPSDDGLLHTLAFTNRILGRIRETWLKRMVAKDIYFP